MRLRLLLCLRFSSLSILVTSLLLICASLSGQQTSSTSATKDAQALTVLNQALTAAGGITAIGGIKDYRASGTLTFHQSPTEPVEGTVTLSGLGRGEFRMDSNLSTGARSLSISQGRTHRKREDGTVSHFPPEGPIPSSDAFPYVTPMFPSGVGFPNQELLAAVNGPQLSVSYIGLVQLNGSSVHDIQVRRARPGPSSMTEYNAIDLFIDASTLQIVMTQDTVPRHVIHQIHYSDYRLVNGIVVPFSISEQVASQRTWDIQLKQIGFNAGLQDADFQL